MTIVLVASGVLQPELTFFTRSGRPHLRIATGPAGFDAGTGALSEFLGRKGVSRPGQSEMTLALEPAELEVDKSMGKAVAVLGERRTWLLSVRALDVVDVAVATELELPTGALRTVRWSPGREQFAVLGRVFDVLSTRDGRWRIVVVDGDDMKTARGLELALERASSVLPAPADSAIPGTVIVGESLRHVTPGGHSPGRDGANCFPWRLPAESRQVQRAASLLAARELVLAHGYSGEDAPLGRAQTAALVTIVSRALQYGLFARDECPPSVDDLDRALLCVNEFGVNGVLNLDARRRHPHTLDHVGKNALAPLVLQDPAVRSRLNDVGADVRSETVYDLIDASRLALRSLTREAVRSRLAGRLDAWSVVAPTAERDIAGHPFMELAGGYVGYIEDCGCLPAQSAGGLTRLIARWSAAPADTLRIVAGDMIARPGTALASGPSTALMLDGLRRVRLHAFVPGTTEIMSLALGTLDYGALRELPVVACNVRSRGRARGLGLFRDYVTVRIAPHRPVHVVGVFTAMAPASEGDIATMRAALDIECATSAVERVVRGLPTDEAVVVVGSMDARSMEQIARHVGERGLVISTEDSWPRLLDGNVSPFQLEGRLHGAHVVFSRVGRHGVDVVSRGSDGAAAVEALALRDAVAPDDPFALHVASALAAQGDGDVELEFDDPQLTTRNSYVGSNACGQCHPMEMKHWMETPHGKAMSTLRKVQRHRVANCVACHVVGYGQRSGYDRTRPVSELEGVGCEVCHGPGALHVANPSDHSAIRRTPDAELCASCHTLEHSDLLLGKEAEHMQRIRHAPK